MSKKEFKTCNEQYCNGLGNCCVTTSSNCCVCLEYLKTNKKESTTNNLVRDSIASNEASNNSSDKVSNCLSTIVYFPFKTAILIPSCPFIVFCPNICLSIKETLCKMC